MNPLNIISHGVRQGYFLKLYIMKKISLQQMEKLNGGYTASCYAGLAAGVVGTIAIGFFTFGTGAVLFALGSSVGGWGITAAGCLGK
jgi:hypothetical protein